MYVISLSRSCMTWFFWFIENSMFMQNRKLYQIHSVSCRLFNDKVQRVTRGGEELCLPCRLSEIGKNALILIKKALIAVICGLYFSFKVQF